MKFYCEENKTFYNTPEECEAAEQAIREARAAKDMEKEEDEKNVVAKPNTEKKNNLMSKIDKITDEYKYSS